MAYLCNGLIDVAPCLIICEYCLGIFRDRRTILFKSANNINSTMTNSIILTNTRSKYSRKYLYVGQLDPKKDQDNELCGDIYNASLLHLLKCNLLDLGIM